MSSLILTLLWTKWELCFSRDENFISVLFLKPSPNLELDILPCSPWEAVNNVFSLTMDSPGSAWSLRPPGHVHVPHTQHERKASEQHCECRPWNIIWVRLIFKLRLLKLLPILATQSLLQFLLFF